MLEPNAVGSDPYRLLEIAYRPCTEPGRSRSWRLDCYGFEGVIAASLGTAGPQTFSR
jgi:hypothetical protein